MPALTTVAIPTLNPGPDFRRTLAAVGEQALDHVPELLVCDSGSSDGTVELARSFGARVLEIPRASFSHGGTRNLLMAEAHGAHVAFLTQDAIPADSDWLAGLLEAFDLAPDVGLAFGPYRARRAASISVARELDRWFASFSHDGEPRIDALEPPQRDAPAGAFLGQLGFFTDANGCVARAAWERVPFRRIASAEDHQLAQDMLRAGYAKVYMPGAAVIHSHEYSPWQWLQRSFDETRAVREVYGQAPGGELRDAARNLRGNVKGDWSWARAASGGVQVRALAEAAAHHGARTAGAMLGARADRLPARLTAQLSLEGRR